MDDELRLGMQALLARWREALAAGDGRAGWKIGFNDPGARQRFGIPDLLVGYLTTGSVVPCGGSCALPGGARTMLEIEIAIELAEGVPAGTAPHVARGAIARLLPALELVDFARSFESPRAILEHDIFHVAAVFNDAAGRDGASLDGVAAQGWKNGQDVGPADLSLVPADLGELVRHVADTLGTFGEELRAGERILAGSLVKPVPVAAGDMVIADLGALGRVEVRLS